MFTSWRCREAALKARRREAAKAGSAARGSLSGAFAALFLLFLAGSAFTGRLPFAVLFFYLGASAVSFLVYMFDKEAAVNNHRRTPENTLQMLGLIGGWPGALIAQQRLRHKTGKLSFRVVFWATVLLNCSVLAWLFSPSGSNTVASILPG
jgi:uncharacterized membrane protein YsdA (DUF1294 family)